MSRPSAPGSVDVCELEAVADLRAAEDLFVRVWGAERRAAPVSADLLRALTHCGGYVAGVRGADGRLIGASVGLLGRAGGRPTLHSHITGLLPEEQIRGVGFALKLHQRAWALAQGIDLITWTFDPLVRRNGYFNLAKLGAEITGFHENFYGRMDDSLNGGDESDRCEVTWRLRSARAVAAASSGLAPADVGALLAAGASALLDEGSDGGPSARAGLGGDVRLCRVPEDVVALRSAAPAIAAAWRHALRATLGAAVADGFVIAEMSRDGWYVLRRR